MGDVLFVLAVLVFFALGAAMVRFCDALIGPDAEGDLVADDETPVRDRAA